MHFEPPPSSRVLQVLGAGSQCLVARVEIGALSAICKRLRPRMRCEPAAREALEREAAILAAVRHPAVPELIDAGEDEHGPYLIQTAHLGVSLRDLVAALSAQHGQVPSATLRAVAESAFEALAALHAAADASGPLDVVHGDLGPDHVIVGPARPGERGVIGFVDFGQARARGVLGRPEERGTVPYVAPEVARAERPPDQSADVFALAATIAFAALGRDPWRQAAGPARLVETAERGLDLSALSEAPGLEPRLVQVLHGAAAFERERRLLSAEAVVAELRGEPVGD